MTSRALVLALLLGSASGAIACLPATCDAYRDPSNSLHGGSTSVQFLTFGGGSRAPFRTSGLYLKTHLSDGTALRVGTDLTLDESSGEDPLQTNGTNVSNTRNYSLSVSSELQRYVDRDGPVAVFLGVGPYWNRARSYNDAMRTNPDVYGGWFESYRFEQRSWEVGASLAVGFEWFFKRKLSLLGRVGSTVGFGKRHEFRSFQYGYGPQYPPSVERFDATTASAGISSAALGLGVYF